MSQPQDYFSTVRYEPGAKPPRRPGGPPWGWIFGLGCGIPVLASVVSLALVARSCGQILSGEKSFGKLITAPAKVHIGRGLKWQSIDRLRASALTNLAVGDFDGDSADEFVLMVKPIPGIGDVLSEDPAKHRMDEPATLKLYELDGTGKLLQASYEPRYLGKHGWDWDGDGRAELVAPDDTVSGRSVTGVYDLDLERHKQLPGLLWALDMPEQADFNADGQPELVLDDTAASALQIYTLQGKLLKSVSRKEAQRGYCFADTDGDHKAEIYFEEEQGGQTVIRGVSISGQSVSLSGWDPLAELGAAYDLNGDGRQELCWQEHAIFQPLGNSTVKLKYPEGFFKQMERFGLDSSKMAEIKDDTGKGGWPLACDLDGDGRQEVICSIEGRMSGSLFAFDLNGDCVWYEDLGEPIRDIAIARDAQGRPVLIVVGEEKLLLGR